MPSGPTQKTPPPVAATSALSLSVGGAHVGELDRVERARRGERGARAVGDAVEPALARPAACRCCARRCSGASVSVAVVPSGAVTVHRAVVRFERLARDDEAVAVDRRAQIVFLELGLLHQPVGERGAAARPAGRRPRSRAPTATSGRRAAARRGPRRRGRAPAAAGRWAPVITVVPRCGCASTWRNQRPQRRRLAVARPARRADRR